MYAKVDKQNAGDKAYTPLVGNEKGAAYQAACDPGFKGLAPAQRLHRAVCCTPGA